MGSIANSYRPVSPPDTQASHLSLNFIFLQRFGEYLSVKISDRQNPFLKTGRDAREGGMTPPVSLWHRPPAPRRLTSGRVYYSLLESRRFLRSAKISPSYG